jgi:hypothetical protein
MAAEPQAPVAKSKSIQASMRQAAAREVAKTPMARKAANRAVQDNSPKQSGGFFKSGPGIAALAVMAAGTGYALYSVSHDRVHSPAKQ